MTNKPDLTNIEPWACCDWPRRATIAEHKNIQLTQMLARIRVAFDAPQDPSCPCCNKNFTTKKHHPKCIVFEIDRLLNAQDEEPDNDQ